MAEDIQEVLTLVTNLTQKIERQLKDEPDAKVRQILFLLYADLRNFRNKLRNFHTIANFQEFEEKYMYKFRDHISQLHSVTFKPAA